MQNETVKADHGYRVHSYNIPIKRYCQTLDLKDNPQLIAEYRKRHNEAEHWAEIRKGIEKSASWKWRYTFSTTDCS